MKYIWIFTGNAQSSFPSAAFSSKDRAGKWILENKLTGTLTKYPVDISVYDWAIQKGYFTPKSEMQANSKAVGNFSSAHLEHYHFDDGE